MVLYGKLAYAKRIQSNMLTHKDPADFPSTSSPERLCHLVDDAAR